MGENVTNIETAMKELPNYLTFDLCQCFKKWVYQTKQTDVKIIEFLIFKNGAGAG